MEHQEKLEDIIQSSIRDLKEVFPRVTDQNLDDFKTIIKDSDPSTLDDLKLLEENDFSTILPKLPVRKLLQLWKNRGKLRGLSS